MSDVDKDAAEPKESKLEKEPDHVASEPAKVHADVHEDQHHTTDGHGDVIDMIPENSMQDKVLQLATVLAGLGLIIMMLTWSQISLPSVSEGEPTSSHESHP